MTTDEIEALAKRLEARAKTHNTSRAVGAGDGATHVMGYYDAYCAKDDSQSAAALRHLMARVSELERENTELKQKEMVAQTVCDAIRYLKRLQEDI